MSAFMREMRMPDSAALIASPVHACDCAVSHQRANAAAVDTASAYLTHLYACEGLSTYRIAELTGVDRQRVTRALRRAGVPLRHRGAGRHRPTRRRDDPPDIEELLADLYEKARFSSRQIGELLGMPERTVRDRLRRYGLSIRTRGGRKQVSSRLPSRLVSWASAPEFGELCGKGSALVVASSSSGRTQRQIHRIGAEHVLGVAVREDRFDSAAACA